MFFMGGGAPSPASSPRSSTILARHRALLLFVAAFSLVVVSASYLALTGFVQQSRRSEKGNRVAVEPLLLNEFSPHLLDNFYKRRRSLLARFFDDGDGGEAGHGAGGDTPPGVLVNSIEIDEDYHTKVLMRTKPAAATMEEGAEGEGGWVDEYPEYVGFAQEVSPVSPPRRYQWLKSIANIFSGERVVSDDEHLEDTSKSPYIVVFKNSSSVEQLRNICMQYGIFVKANADCNMPEVCRRVYASTFRGVSGFFSQVQLNKLLSCFEDTVDYVEKDRVVYKAEDSPKHQRMMYRFDSSAVIGPEHEYPVSREMEAIGSSFAGQLGSGNPSDVGLDSRRVSAFGHGKSQDLNVALWNLDRIDQRALPLDGKYTYSGGTGRGVTIYTVDSGLRSSHQEFSDWNTGRSRASHGWDFVDDDPDAEDCDGHGTHVAGTAVGRTTGIAKDAKVVGVRVLDCAGSGSVSDVVAGLDWVATHHRKPAIVTMSLGIGVGSWSRALEEAVKNLIVDYGITVIVASGNSGVDSCYVAPGNVVEPITVAASDLDTKFAQTSAGDQESLYRWSNTGECIDIFAPGVDIYSACGGDSRCTDLSDTAYAWASGTSMAVPLVAGVAANYLQERPMASPEEVKQTILGSATAGVLSSPHMKPGSPNLLLYSKVSSRPSVRSAAG